MILKSKTRLVSEVLTSYKQ